MSRESGQPNTGRELAVQNVRQLLEFFGEDPEREGLKNTPNRVIKFYEEFFNVEPFKWTTFKKESDEMIIVKDIPFYSLCEHHMALFYGTAAIAYIPNETQVGLSKLPRCLEQFSRRFQNQERITMQVADEIVKKLEPIGVAVVLKGEHTCMSARGAKVHGTKTITSTMTGVFKDNLACRNEFINLIS